MSTTSRVFEILTAGKPTAGKKIYPEHVLRAEIDRLTPSVEQGNFVGELGASGPLISWANVSHVVTDFWLGIGGVLKAEIQTLDTPSGKILRNLLDYGAPVKLCLVGVGHVVDLNGDGLIQDDYKLIQIEAVADTGTATEVLHYLKGKMKTYRSIDDP